MKSVLLDNDGYTADGQWRLVVVDPKPEMSAKGLCVSEAEHDPAGVYRAMVAASPSPELAEAVPVGCLVVTTYKNDSPLTPSREFFNTVEATQDRIAKGGYPKDWYELIPLFTAPPAPAATDKRIAELESEIKDRDDQHRAMCRTKNAKIAELEAENQALRADAKRYRAIRNPDEEFSIAAVDDDGVLLGEELDAAIDAAKGMNRG